MRCKTIQDGERRRHRHRRYRSGDDAYGDERLSKHARHSRCAMMSRQAPAGHSMPSEMDFVFSEGAGLLVFEELEHAKARERRDLL